MTKYLVEKDTLDDLADAIREQTGDVNPMKLADFASNVRSISGGTTVTKFTATLTSTQYGWFTFEDENGNVLELNSDNSPLYATAISGSNYYIGSFVACESTNRYLFKIYDINDSSAHGYVGSSKTLTFDMAYVESTQSGGESGHSYSTSEQIVGTWVDGSTVYEKTIAVNNQIGKSTWAYIDTIADISKIINSSVIVYENSGGRTYGVREGYFCEASTNDGGKVGLYNNTNFDPSIAYVVIRYTKQQASLLMGGLGTSNGEEENTNSEEENREQEGNER